MPLLNRLLFAESPILRVRDVQLSATDSLPTRREKLARIVLDEMCRMYQFVGLLDVNGNTLEINRAALEGAGIHLADVEGKPFWEARWWPVSREFQEQQRDLVRRARQGEFVRCDIEIYARAAGEQTIIIDYSLSPIKDENGRIVFLLVEGRDITQRKQADAKIARKNQELEKLRAAQSPGAVRQPATGQPLVIFSEENAEMRRFISEVLSDLYRIVPCIDGAEALATAIAQPPDLLITDLLTPQLGGSPLVEEMRRVESLAHVPILVLSATADDERRVKLLAESVQDYLVKPFSAQELRAQPGGHKALP
jgi:PAS domain S-box-containing protein